MPDKLGLLDADLIRVRGVMVKPMVCGDLREVTLRHFGLLTVT